LTLSLKSTLIWADHLDTNPTGYNQSVTCCGSERRHVVVTQRKLIKKHDPHPQIEFDFVEHHTHFNIIFLYVSQRSQIQFED